MKSIDKSVLALLLLSASALSLVPKPVLAIPAPNTRISQADSAPEKRKYSNKEILHLINRISFGAAPGDLERVKKLGVEKYIDEQLHPEKIEVPANLQELNKLPALSETPAKLFLTYGRPALKEIAQKANSDKPEDKNALQKVLRETYQRLFEDTSTARLERAVESPAQLQEVMTDFWYNHFNISIDKNLDHLWVGSFEEKAIRPHTLGKFRDLLGATAHHAAMLFYLDNWQNTAPSSQLSRGRFQGINENYARELMELHTLGVDGGYTQKDVQELARVLTGLGLPPGAGGGFGNANKRDRLQQALNRPGQQFGQERRRDIFQSENPSAGVDLNNTLGSYFDARRHDFGDKLVIGYRIKGSGENEIEEVLDILARHPSTARHISYKLAQYFVNDNPPASLVDKLSKKYLESDGLISEVLDTLFHSPEFWSSASINAKFKSPYRYLLSSMRATQGRIERVQPALAVLTQLGMPLYKCLTPDGYKNTKEAWLNPDNLINRINFATAYGLGRYPGVRPQSYDAAAIADCIGPTLSDKTIDAVMKAPANMRVALLLGSPEFMKY